ncbi:hypothetical protein [uncultured Methanobrevibacter sp.]|uniref:hypothetical protein n=1 Tax=uncultured Methanobrevibacter sp. TaxID=253161 RepID=UPI0025FB0A47|nr:hypothetical protein [uncultured Methanobrevibacter sp.]
MENKGTIIVPIIGYIISLFYPIIGLLFGAALVFFKKDTPLYQKHGRFIIFFSIIVFVIRTILLLVFSQ